MLAGPSEAPHAFLDPFHGSGFRGKRTRVLGLYTCPPEDATVVCVDELGLVIPRILPPAPGWSPDGHRIKAELDYSRGPEKTWVYGGLRVTDGQQVTMTASSRNSAFYQRFLQKLEEANQAGDIYVVTDNLSSHNSLSTRTWLEDHPRIRHVFLPVGACWLIDIRLCQIDDRFLAADEAEVVLVQRAVSPVQQST
ncbi:transposase [Streptomyces sp. NPDC059757]|uniref:transposase n=1 Tax=Streptomyces sp. NPDC059757 TaxID=3346935 RepID=UPI0036495E49